MSPHLRCATCGYHRKVDLRGLLAKATTCPRCPDNPRLVLERTPDASAPNPEIPGTQDASARLH
jgi:hypothetical protein